MTEHERLQQLHADGKKCGKCCGEKDHAGCSKCKDKERDAGSNDA